jgi:hypothetical protein|uniref:Uncharacterized protein n=1 Tax=Zea mays TaxID=4577 RepID=B6T572_MAIZE|nr:hypothetical protein [Zea mays]
MAAVRHATVIFLFLTITFAAMANGAGETDPDPARVENPVDCMIGCASRLIGYAMQTMECAVGCAGEGRGSAVEEKHAAVFREAGRRQHGLEN